MQHQNTFNKIMIASFCGVMVLGFVLGLAFFLRPSYSESEKRDLTDFPTFTLTDFGDLVVLAYGRYQQAYKYSFEKGGRLIYDY